MEGNLQLLYVLLTDCYVYLLRKGARRPPTPGPARAAAGGSLSMRPTALPFPAPPPHTPPALGRSPSQQPQETSAPCHSPPPRGGQVLENGAGGGKRGHCESQALGSPLSGAAEKPYLVEEAVSYNELDYVSVSAGSAVGTYPRPGLLGLPPACPRLGPTAPGLGPQLLSQSSVHVDAGEKNRV